MAKIIELYGLPGCGKTTLRDNLVISSNKKASYALMTELSQKYRKQNLYNKIKYIPLRTWWNICIFIISMPKHKPSEWILYRIFFNLALVYNFSKFTKGSDYIIIDHGFIQALVSLMNGNTIQLSEKQEKRFIRMISPFYTCTFAYCSIPVEKSLERIRIRKRSHGRLDIIRDDNVLKNKLVEEKDIFENISKQLTRTKDINNIKLDCSFTIKENVSSLIKIISNEK